MQIEDDEILQGFIEESLEHLADIENDFLAIEEAGADIDEELVNKGLTINNLNNSMGLI